MMTVLRDAMFLAFKLALPMLIVSLAVGLLIAIFQAATQIHEQTLTFVPKVIVVALLMLFTAPWMIQMMRDFVTRLFAVIANVPNL